MAEKTAHQYLLSPKPQNTRVNRQKDTETQKNTRTGTKDSNKKNLEIWKADKHGNQLGGLKATSKSTSQADRRENGEPSRFAQQNPSKSQEPLEQRVPLN